MVTHLGSTYIYIYILLRCQICDDTPYAGNAKTNFCLRFKNYKSKHQFFRKGKQNVPQKRFHSHYVQDCHKGIDDWEVTLFEKCETHKQLKERETFLATQIENIYPLVLNGKEEYLKHNI